MLTLEFCEISSSFKKLRKISFSAVSTLFFLSSLHRGDSFRNSAMMFVGVDGCGYHISNCCAPSPRALMAAAETMFHRPCPSAVREKGQLALTPEVSWAW